MSRPLRVAAFVFVLGFLVVWLIRPIGNPCPDRGALPQGSSKSSSPSFLPPGTRICTYTTPEGTKATFHYVPWLDWLVLAVLAGLAAVAVHLASRDAARPPRAAREPRAQSRRPPREQRGPRAERDRSRKGPSERDAADRERARQERLDRARREPPG
jgi:hypothetical protein